MGGAVIAPTGAKLQNRNQKQETSMKLTRAIFIALAVLVPATWTIAKAAGDEKPADEKKEKKGKKADGDDKKGDKKEEKKEDKK